MKKLSGPKLVKKANAGDQQAKKTLKPFFHEEDRRISIRPLTARVFLDWIRIEYPDALIVRDSKKRKTNIEISVDNFYHLSIEVLPDENFIHLLCKYWGYDNGRFFHKFESQVSELNNSLLDNKIRKKLSKGTQERADAIRELEKSSHSPIEKAAALGVHVRTLERDRAALGYSKHRKKATKKAT